MARQGQDESPAHDFLRTSTMAKKLDDIMATLPAQRRARIEGRAMKLATPKVVRKVVEASRKDLSAVFDVVPNAISSSK